MGEYNVTINDDGTAVLSRKGAGAPVLVAAEPVDPQGTEVVTPETPVEVTDDAPKGRRRGAEPAE